MVETVERMIALEGAVNFRDLGGYGADAGRQTRWRTLFRADGLGELTEADLSVLRGFDIRTVIDLRSGSELERGQFDVEAHPVAFHHFPFIDELPDAQDFDRRPGLLGSQYLEIVRDAGGQILAALEVLDEQAGAVAADVQRQPHGRELVHQVGEDAASGRSVHLPSITAYKCQNQWKEVQCPLAYRV